MPLFGMMSLSRFREIGRWVRPEVTCWASWFEDNNGKAVQLAKAMDVLNTYLLSYCRCNQYALYQALYNLVTMLLCRVSGRIGFAPSA